MKRSKPERNETKRNVGGDLKLLVLKKACIWDGPKKFQTFLPDFSKAVVSHKIVSVLSYRSANEKGCKKMKRHVLGSYNNTPLKFLLVK